MEIKTIEFERPLVEGGRGLASTWSRVPEAVSPDQRRQLKDKNRRLLKEKAPC